MDTVVQSRVSRECTPELRNTISGSGTLLTVGFSDLAKWYKFGTNLIIIFQDLKIQILKTLLEKMLMEIISKKVNCTV